MILNNISFVCSVGLVLRQLTDGLHFVQTISNIAGEIVDCEYIEDDATVRKFLKDFKRDLSSTFTKKNKKNQKGGTRKEKRKKYLSKIARKQQKKNNKKQNAQKKSRELKKELDDYTDLYNDGDWEDFNDGTLATGDDYLESSNDGLDDIPFEADKLENFEVLQQDQAVFRDDYKIAFGKILPKRFKSGNYDFENSRNLSKFDSDLRFGRKRNQKARVLARKNFDLMDESLRNVTVFKLLEGSKLPEDVAEWLDIRVLEERCDGVHRQLQQSLGMDRDVEDVEMRDEGTLERLVFKIFFAFFFVFWIIKTYCAFLVNSTFGIALIFIIKADLVMHCNGLPVTCVTSVRSVTSDTPALLMNSERLSETFAQGGGSAKQSFIPKVKQHAQNHFNFFQMISLEMAYQTRSSIMQLKYFIITPLRIHRHSK